MCELTDKMRRLRLKLSQNDKKVIFRRFLKFLSDIKVSSLVENVLNGYL